MKVKKFIYFSVVVLIIAFTLSCKSSEPVRTEIYTYTGFKNIYPAVYHVIKNGPKINYGYSSTRVRDMDDIIIDKLYAMDGLRFYEFSLRIFSYENKLTFDFGNFKSRPLNNDVFTTSRDFSDETKVHFMLYFNTEIPKVLENDDLYYQALKEVFISQGAKEADAAAEADRLRQEEAEFNRQYNG